MTDFAPIVLFVYDRPEHTKRTIEALQKNEGAQDTELFIFSDAAKNEGANSNVDKVRAYINDIDGFKKLKVIERSKNWGLAKSIIEGVTDIVNKYGKIIVLEDDLVTSPYFLKYMNTGLKLYEKQEHVWHISGWNYPINSVDLESVYLWRLMNCWGWATWKNRWNYFENNSEKIINTFTKNDIYKFNIDGSEDFFGQIRENHKGKINTWAIFWYATIFKNNGLCLCPNKTLVLNIGNDGSGKHQLNDNSYSSEVDTNPDFAFTIQLQENKLSIKRLKYFYKKRYYRHIYTKVKSILLFKKTK